LIIMKVTLFFYFLQLLSLLMQPTEMSSAEGMCDKTEPRAEPKCTRFHVWGCPPEEMTVPLKEQREMFYIFTATKVDMRYKWLNLIGLEVHTQLKPDSCKNDMYEEDFTVQLMHITPETYVNEDEYPGSCEQQHGYHFHFKSMVDYDNIHFIDLPNKFIKKCYFDVLSDKFDIMFFLHKSGYYLSIFEIDGAEVNALNDSYGQTASGIKSRVYLTLQSKGMHDVDLLQEDSFKFFYAFVFQDLSESEDDFDAFDDDDDDDDIGFYYDSDDSCNYFLNDPYDYYNHYLDDDYVYSFMSQEHD
jgi:hypothetical protein